MRRGFKDEIKDCFPRNERGIAIPINVDIDGTVIFHGFDIDKKKFRVNGKSMEILKRWVNDYNCAINIYTSRYGEKLQEAIDFFKEHEVPVTSVGGNPQQNTWTNSNKQYGFVFDDMSPVKIFYDENGRATVDWDFIVEVFEPRLKLMKQLINELNQEAK